MKPFGVPFRVTPKGSGNEDSAFDVYTFFSITFWVAVTALGLVINIVPEWSHIGEGEFSLVSTYWAGLNILVLLVAALICFEKPRPLLDSFATDEPALVLGVSEKYRQARIVSLSLEGGIAEFALPPDVREGEHMWVEMDAFPHLRCKIEKVASSKRGRPVAVKFSYTLEGECRDRMIVKLYTGRYSQDIHEIDKSAIFGGIWLRMFGRNPKAA